jgi:hypothetical protein
MAAVPPLYHERQQGALCAVHAANNLLQRAAFTRGDFARLQRRVPAEAAPACGGCLRCCPERWCCRRCRVGEDFGNFDANVLLMALGEKRTALQHWDARKTDVDQLLGRLEAETCTGALLHTTAASHGCLVAAGMRCLARCFGQNGHWLALLRRTPQGTGEEQVFVVDLDSKLAAPKAYTKQGARALLARHLRVNTTILLASRMDAAQKGPSVYDTK